jgi:Ca2+-binding RTX toxin-like protein
MTNHPTADAGGGDDLISGSFSTVYGGSGNDSITGSFSIAHGGLGDDYFHGDLFGVINGDDGDDTIFQKNRAGSIWTSGDVKIISFLGGTGNDSIIDQGGLSWHDDSLGRPIHYFDGGEGTDRIFLSDPSLSYGHQKRAFNYATRSVEEIHFAASETRYNVVFGGQLIFEPGDTSLQIPLDEDARLIGDAAGSVSADVWVRISSDRDLDYSNLQVMDIESFKVSWTVDMQSTSAAHDFRASALGDTIYVGSAGRFFGGEGNDRIQSGTIPGATPIQSHLHGEAGNDTIFAYHNTFVAASGGDGTDTFEYGSSNYSNEYRRAPTVIDLSSGLVDGATISGFENVIGIWGDTIIGSDDDNVISIAFGLGAGRFDFDGRGGSDTLDLRDHAGSSEFILDGSNYGAMGGATWIAGIFKNIENILAGSGNNLLRGDALDNILSGGGGDDTIFGGGGTDTAKFTISSFEASLAPSTSGDGSVLILSTEGNDLLHPDIEFVQFADMTLAFGDLASVLGRLIEGTPGDDTITGTPGRDSILGYEGDDRIDGRDGSDWIDHGTGRDTVIGGDGDDYIHSSEGNYTAAGNEDSLSGGAGNDTIHGRAGNDTLMGGDGDDQLYGGNHSDHLHSEAGSDRLDGGDGIDFVHFEQRAQGVDVNLLAGRATSGSDTIVLVSIEQFRLSNHDDVFLGYFGSDTVFGLSGNDSLDGGGGHDRLTGGPGDDTIRGGAGGDSAIFAVASTTVSVRTEPGWDYLIITGEGVDQVFNDVELFQFTDRWLVYNDVVRIGNNDIVGTAGNDTLIGTPRDERILGLGGNDLLNGLTGSDTLDGGDGLDLAIFTSRTAGIDADLARGTALSGADTVRMIAIENIFGSNFDDTIAGDGGANILQGAAGNDRLSGGDGNDRLIPGAGNSTLFGGAGSDSAEFSHALAAVSVTHDPADDFLTLRTADGTHVVHDDIETVVFSDQSLTWARVAALGGLDTIRGTAGDDILYGTAAAEVILGLEGNDFITPRGGSDQIDGGAGSDMVSFSDHGVFVTVDLAAGTAIAGADVNLLTSIENVTGTIYADVITGDGANNRLRGLGDYDWFIGSGGSDSYDGGDGKDMVSYASAPGAVGVHLGSGRGFMGQADGDRYTSVERVSGSAYGDLFYGSDGEDEFRGLGGYDMFIGSGGGRDRYDGGSGVDTVAYTLSGSGVSASLALGYGLAGDAAYDLYTSIENLTGSGFADTLTGDDQRNTLRGLSGDDLLQGMGGVDYLFGGAGNDTLDGGAGTDYAVYDLDRYNYAVTTTGATTTVSYIGATPEEGTDTLINIEYLIFADGTLLV